MRLVLGETIDEILSVARRWPEATTINLPPRTKDAWISRSLPQLFVDADREDILQELNSCEVSPEHVKVMTFQLREDWFRTRCQQYLTPEVEKFFRTEIRGKLILLLRAGKWIDEPENLGLQNWNKRVENYDLGRRSDLNFSSTPIPVDQVQKYDPDFKRDDEGELVERRESEVPDFEDMYRNGSKKVRQEIWNTRPWMRRSFLEKGYGEP
jgi:hypothetical protein